MAKKSSAKIEAVAEAAETATENAEAVSQTVKAKFSKAIEDAKASASAFGKDWQDKAAPYREKLSDRLATADLAGIGEQARAGALSLAADGKVKASDTLASLGKVVADNAALVDDKLGAKYGDYARTAARALQETAARIEAKDLEELRQEAGDFVKKNPAIAVGAAAAVGFVLARMMSGKNSDEA